MGLLTITATRATSLFVDGIAWTPVSSENGVDSYIVSTGGRFSIYMGGQIVFTFVNEIEPDFELLRPLILRFYNSDGDQVGNSVSAEATYVQTTAQPTAVKVRVRITGVYPATVWELEPSCNQGDISLDIEDTAHYLTVTGYDPSKHLEVYLGNVLCAFVTPIS